MTIVNLWSRIPIETVKVLTPFAALELTQISTKKNLGWECIPKNIHWSAWLQALMVAL